VLNDSTFKEFVAETSRGNSPVADRQREKNSPKMGIERKEVSFEGRGS
jgi:hypothetical protein